MRNRNRGFLSSARLRRTSRQSVQYPVVMITALDAITLKRTCGRADGVLCGVLDRQLTEPDTLHRMDGATSHGAHRRARPSSLQTWPNSERRRMQENRQTTQQKNWRLLSDTTRSGCWLPLAAKVRWRSRCAFLPARPRAAWPSRSLSPRSSSTAGMWPLQPTKHSVTTTSPGRCSRPSTWRCAFRYEMTPRDLSRPWFQSPARRSRLIGSWRSWDGTRVPSPSDDPAWRAEGRSVRTRNRVSVWCHPPADPQSAWPSTEQP